MANDNIKTLYNALKERYNIGSESDFRKSLSDEINRHTLYNAIKDSYDIGTEDEFNTSLGYNVPIPSRSPKKHNAGAAAQEFVNEWDARNEAYMTQPLSESERNKYLGLAGNILNTSRAGAEKASNIIDYNKKRKPINVPARINIGENARVVKSNGKYITEAGNAYDNRGEADLEQTQIDDYKEKELHPVESALRDAYAERDRIDEQMRARMKEIDDENNGVGSFLREFADASRQPGMLNPLEKYQTDEQYRQLESAARKNKAAIQTLEDKRDNKMNDFWHSIATTAANGYTFNDGLAEINDAIALMDARKHIDSINTKRKTGEALTKEEAAAAAVLSNDAFNTDIQGLYAGDYGVFASAGQMIPTSIDMMKDIWMTPGAGGIAKGIARKVSGIGAKYLAKEAGGALAREVPKNVARWVLKGTGMLLGAHTAGAVISNTAGINRTAGAMGTNLAGHATMDNKGNIAIKNSMGLLNAFVDAERNQIRENGSEMFGEFIPGLGKTIKKGLENIGLSKISDVLTNIGNKEWYRQYNKLLTAGGYNGIPGQGLEEYEGIVFDALTGHADEAWEQLKDTRTHADIWLGTALMSALLGAVPVTLQGAHTAQYYAYKHKTDKSERIASYRFGDADKWSALKNEIENTTNGQMADVVVKIMSDNGLNTQQKTAVLDYVRNLTKMRGFNIGQMANANGQSKENEAVNNSYSEGYNAADDEFNNIKNTYDQYKTVMIAGLGINEDALESGSIDWLNEAVISMSSGTELGKKRAQTILGYLNAKSRYDGMIQRVRDDLDSRIEESNAVVDSHVNKSDGMIHPAEMKATGTEGKGRRAYVINGDVVMFPDGTGVDHTKSSQSILIRYADTGELEMVDPAAIMNTDEPIDPAQEKIEAEDAIIQSFAKPKADIIDGKVAFNPGDAYMLTDEKGQTAEAQVTANAEGVVDNGDGTVNVTFDGGKTVIPMQKEEIQGMVDITNRQRAAAEIGEESSQQNEQNALPEYKQNYGVTVTDKDGNIISGNIQAVSRDDNYVLIDNYDEGFARPIPIEQFEQNVQSISDEEGNVIWERDKEQPPYDENFQQTDGETTENGNNDAEKIPQNGNNEPQNIPAATESMKADAGGSSVLGRIPKDEQGQPIYDETDPETAWDAITEQSGGDENIAGEVIADLVEEYKNALKSAEKELKRIQEGKPVQKKGDTPLTVEERIAAKKAAKEQLAQAQSNVDAAKKRLAAWQEIAKTPTRRKDAALAEQKKAAEEAAKARKEAEEKERAQREEEERVRREVLNGVPDFVEDTPQDARARGYRRVNGDKVDRQQPIPAKRGNVVQVKFDDNNIPTGHVALIDASQLQPSHINGQRNPIHFIDEAQPKERNDETSIISAHKIASNIRPEEITSSITAYTGAPTVNSRGEVIQGNNRSTALREMWAEHPEQAARYRQYLTDHVADFGLSYEDVESISQPVLVNMLDVTDNDAVTLGQFVAQDTESGGTERIKPKNIVLKMGGDMSSFANKLLASPDEEMSFAELVDRNGSSVLKWMQQKGYITPTQYKSAFDSKGGLTAEAKNDLKGVMYQSIFQNGNTHLEEMFNALPSKAQKAILATAYRDYDSPNTERMNAEIQNSISAYHALSQDPTFANAKNYKEARIAAESWKRQLAFDDVTGESYLPADKYSNFALLLATMYKGQTQTFIQNTFKHIYDLVQGTQEATLFEEPDNTPRSLAKAINEAISNVRTELLINNQFNYNGQQRSNVLAGDNTTSQQGRQGSDGAAPSGERVEDGDGTADRSRGTGSGSTEEEIERREAKLASRVEVSDDDWQEGDNDNPTYKRSILIDGKHTVTQVDQPDKDGHYTGSYFEFDNKRFGDIAEIVDYIDSDHTLASKIAQAEAETEQNPTEAQKEAGNYKKGHVRIGQFDITVENPKGSVRRGIDANGKEWEHTMLNTYGYIRGTEGVDGDHIDVFLTNDIDGWNGRKVYVVDQYNPDGSFDEHKVMLGFNEEDDARNAYFSNYSKDWADKHKIVMSSVNLPDFERWIDSSHRKTKPFAEYKTVKKDTLPESPQLMLQQYRDLKNKDDYQDRIILMETGDFYETYEEDAIKVSDILGTDIRQFKGGETYTSFPSNKLNVVLTELIKSGHRAAVIETLPDVERKRLMSSKGKGKNKQENESFTPRSLSDIKADRESIIRDTIEDLKDEYTSANLSKTDEEIRKDADELVDYNEESDLYMEAWDRLECLIGAESMDKLEADARRNGEDKLSLATMIDEIERNENREQEETAKVKQQSGHVEKIEDVGEKIGGAKKDRFKELAEKEKQIQEKPDSFMEELRNLPVSKIFNFNLEALRKDGLSNEAATLIDVIRRVIPSKPRTDWKLKRWVSDVFGMYSFCLTLATAEKEAFDNVLEEAVRIKQIGGMYRAQMALGGFDSGLDTGQATLEELGDNAGHYDKDGNWVSIKGQWYVTHAGRYGGIYSDHEQAKEALAKFAGENSKPKGRGSEVKFSIYSYKRSGEAFITPQGKPGIVVESGFKSSKEALDYLNEHMDELQIKYRNMKDATSIGFAPNGERRGKDWRRGKDVTAEDFRNTFGFRGVEFGNWTNQQERQRALNQAYDAFIDLSEATGISPQGLSLGGELGMAFGARGNGSAAAHYESRKVVINLTKTQGAGTLAHEWWHAIDNYFSRRRGQALGYNTERKGYKQPGRGGKVEFESEAERKEITDAFTALMKAINGSSYGERSNAYASLKSSYWKEPTELGARAFAVWVERKLSEKGIVNNFLANNNVIGWESPELTQKYYPYPLESDFESLDTAFDGLFGAIEEKVDEETGNTVLYRFVGEQGASRLDAAEEATTRMDNLAVARKMEEEGENVRAIKWATGWERGADRKWRYETLDFEYTPPENFEEGKNYNLSDIIKDDELFTAYPKLKGFRLRFRHLPDEYGGGWFDKWGKEIVINTARNIPWNYESTIAHEIQHAIQAEEGFEKGDNPNAVIDRYVASQSDLATADISTLNTAAFIRKKAERLIRKGEYKYMRWAVRAAMGRLKGRNGMYEEYGPIETLAVSYTAKDLKLAYERAYEKAYSNGTLVNSGYPTKQEAKFIYMHNAGETEARNVERRLQLTPEQRRNMLASETEDIARADQLFINSALSESASYAPAAEDELSQVNERFNEELQQQINGELPKGHIYSLGQPSNILLSAGLPDLPIEMAASRLSDKSMQENHPFELSEVRNLPNAIQNPMALFRSATHIGSFVVMTEIEHGGKNFVVAIEANKRKGKIEVNSVRSVHYRTSNAHMANWITEGLLEYANKEKMAEWLSKQRYNSADVRKLFNHATNIVKNFENPSVENENLRIGNGALTDDDLSIANDPVSKLTGKSSRTARQRRTFAERERERMVERVQELTEKLHLDNVDIVTDASTLQGRQAKAKGFFSRSTGRITIVIPNHTSVSDAEQTLLHEAVAHYGLRKLFGEHFDTFLDNVIQNAEQDVRRRIVELSKKHGWDFLTATEEYLASLAENTNFKNINASWWGKIKDLFLRMLHKIGFKDFSGVTLSDNELRYILWRSYENLAEPGRYRSILGEAADVAKQYELKVGNYAANTDNLQNDSAADLAGEPSTEDVNRQFNKGLKRWTDGEMGANEYIVAGNPAGILKQFMPDLPIILRQKVLSKSRKKHELSTDDLQNLPSALAAPIFVFKSSDNTISTLTELKNKNGENIFVAIELGVNKQMGHNTLEVNDILTIHGREVENIVNPIVENQSLIWADKEKGLHWLSSAKSNSQAIANEVIDSAANIVRNFENPKIPSEKTGESGDFLYRNGSTIAHPGGGVARDYYEGKTRKPNKLDKKDYNGRLENLLHRISKSYFDSMHALKIFQEAVLKETGNVMHGFDDAYKAENAMASSVKTRQEEWELRYFTPLKKLVYELMEKGKSSYEELKRYIIAKHGLERNETLAKRDYDEYMDAARQKLAEHLKAHPGSKATIAMFADKTLSDFRAKDYSGLTALTGNDNVADAEQEAQRIVSDYESRHGKDLCDRWWKAVNAATKSTLKERYEGGLMSRQAYEYTRDMFEYYIPLKGWDNNVAAEEYEYIHDSRRQQGTPSMKRANGRTSIADDPIATIGAEGCTAIKQSLRNKMKQRFMNFVLNNPTSLTSIGRQWYVKDATGEWIPKEPTIPANADADTIAAAVEQHEADMKRLEAQGLAEKRRGKLRLGLNTTKAEQSEHKIKVLRAGQEYVIYINGNPAVAHAVNGTTNPDVHVGKVEGAYKWLQGKWAAVLTSLNPMFIFANLTMDTLQAASYTTIREDKAYNRLAAKNSIKIFGKRMMPKLLKKWEDGKLDMNDATEHYFYEFMTNGGETGIVQLVTVDKVKKDIDSFIKDAKGGASSIPRKAWRSIWDAVEFLNRAAEDTNRFICYMTSRQLGRDVARSIWDAKEITVNFSKKGDGGMGARQLTWAYVFFNAAMQSLRGLASVVSKNPKKAAAIISSYAGAGFIIPMLNMLLTALCASSGGDDDDDPMQWYWDLPEWQRRNNIVLYIPFTQAKYIMVPLPHELRALYGLGECAFTAFNGKKSVADSAADAIAGFSTMLPLDFTGNGGSLALNLTPSLLQAPAQIISNTDYFGKPIYRNDDYGKYDPEWTKAYNGTSDIAIGLSKLINSIGNFDPEVHKQKWDGWWNNPDVMEHLVSSYFGGVGKTVMQTYKSVSMIWDEDAIELRNVPVLNRFVTEVNEKNKGSNVSSRYHEAVDEYEQTEHDLGIYKKKTKDGIEGYAEALTDFMNTDEFKRYKAAKGYVKAVGLLQRELYSIKDKTELAAVRKAIGTVQSKMLDALERERKAGYPARDDDYSYMDKAFEERIEDLTGAMKWINRERRRNADGSNDRKLTRAKDNFRKKINAFNDDKGDNDTIQKINARSTRK